MKTIHCSHAKCAKNTTFTFLKTVSSPQFLLNFNSLFCDFLGISTDLNHHRMTQMIHGAIHLSAHIPWHRQQWISTWNARIKLKLFLRSYWAETEIHTRLYEKYKFHIFELKKEKICVNYISALKWQQHNIQYLLRNKNRNSLDWTVCNSLRNKAFRNHQACLLVFEKLFHHRTMHALTSARARRSCTLRTPSCLTTFLAPSATAASILRWCLSSSTRSSRGLIVSEGRPAKQTCI